jgi:hypothetical protein
MERGTRPPLSEAEKRGIDALLRWISQNRVLASYITNPYEGTMRNMIGLGKPDKADNSSNELLLTIAEVMKEALVPGSISKAEEKPEPDNLRLMMNYTRESWGIFRKTYKQISGRDKAPKNTKYGIFWLLPEGWMPDSQPPEIYRIIEALPASVMDRLNARQKNRKKPGSGPRPAPRRAVPVQEDNNNNNDNDDDGGGGIEPGGEIDMGGGEPLAFLPAKDVDYSLGLVDEDFEKHALGNEAIEAVINDAQQQQLQTRNPAYLQSIVTAMMESMQRQEAKLDTIIQFLNIPSSSSLSVPSGVIAPRTTPSQPEKPASPLPVFLQRFQASKGSPLPGSPALQEKEASRFEFPSEGSQNNYDMFGLRDRSLPAFHFSQPGSQ